MSFELKFKEEALAEWRRLEQHGARAVQEKTGRAPAASACPPPSYLAIHIATDQIEASWLSAGIRSARRRDSGRGHRSRQAPRQRRISHGGKTLDPPNPGLGAQRESTRLGLIGRHPQHPIKISHTPASGFQWQSGSGRPATVQSAPSPRFAESPPGRPVRLGGAVRLVRARRRNFGGEQLVFFVQMLAAALRITGELSSGHSYLFHRILNTCRVRGERCHFFKHRR